MKTYQTVILILTLLKTSLSAEIQDFFKPALNKSENSKMAGIDYIYMINLDERPEKFSQSKNQLEAYNIYPYRFSAVNGWQIPLECINSLGITYISTMPESLKGTRYLAEDEGQPRHEPMILGENYFCYHMSRGAIGIVLSHLSILQDAYNAGYQTIWVMEDDIEVIQDPNMLTDLINQLDLLVGEKKWDVLFTDPDTKNQSGNYVDCSSYAPRPNFKPAHPEKFASKKLVDPNFRKIGARYGAYSMIIRRPGIKKLLDFILKYRLFLPYDLEYIFPNNIHLYSLTFDVVSTLPKALSDNGKPNYINKKSE